MMVQVEEVIAQSWFLYLQLQFLNSTTVIFADRYIPILKSVVS